MITLSSTITLLVIFLLVAFWQSSARAREQANRVSKQMCERENVQFLDGTTVQDTWRFKRGDSGKLGIIRRFHFHFYNGQHKLKGRVTIFQNKITELYLETVLPEVKEPELFKPANEVDNVIQFPKRKK